MDTGLRAAAQNIALDRALLEARHANEIPGTLRFSRFTPCVLIASRQSPAQEADLQYCRTAGIAVQRRITGGDAVYCNGAQLGWALYLHQSDVHTSDMRAVARRICTAIAGAMRASGVNAGYRVPHDIEVEGRRVGSGGGVFEGDAVLYQGVLHLDMDLTALLRATRTPAPALAEGAITAARARIADLKSALGACPEAAPIRDRIIAAFESEFAAEFHDADLSLTEQARFQHALAEIDTPGWVNLVNQPGSDVTVVRATQKHAAGTLNASVRYDRARQRIKQAWFTADWNTAPGRAIVDLEAVLTDTAIERIERNVHTFFSANSVEIPGLTPADFVLVLRRALQLPLVVGGYPAGLNS